MTALLLALALAAEPLGYVMARSPCPGSVFIPAPGPGDDEVCYQMRGCAKDGKPVGGPRVCCYGHGITPACCEEWGKSTDGKRPACALPQS